MTVGARSVLYSPVIYALLTEKLVVARTALHWLSELGDYLVANAAKDLILNVSD